MNLSVYFQGGDASAAASSAPKAPGGAPPPPPPGPPPPPPPAETSGESGGGGGDDARVALFDAINRGTAITSGNGKPNSKRSNSSRLIVMM